MMIDLQNIVVQKLPHFSSAEISVDILRLDLLHPVVSGNKWFKLKYHLEEAFSTGKHTIATFGGAYSNHIIATAYASKNACLKSIGLIRSEKSSVLSPTLQQATDHDMRLIYIDRESYRNKELLKKQHDEPGIYWIDEGGYGSTGAKGAADILSVTDTSVYDHIVCAVGTGTMMAGLVKASIPGQIVTGISVLKGHTTLLQEVDALLTTDEKQKPHTIIDGYDFGGYAKHPAELIRFMNETWQQEQLPTDIVYTGKLLYAVKDLVKRKYFGAGNRILVIHSGGLQGNASLPPNTLDF